MKSFLELAVDIFKEDPKSLKIDELFSKIKERSNVTDEFFEKNKVELYNQINLSGIFVYFYEDESWNLKENYPDYEFETKIV